jgi:hypothetical protein
MAHIGRVALRQPVERGADGACGRDRVGAWREKDGEPLKRLKVSEDCAPSSTRATSRTRTSDPSGLARTTMLSNSFAVDRRPIVSSGNCRCCSGPDGWAPIRPNAAWVFCCCTALITSPGTIEKPVSRSVSSQIRML